MSGPVTIARIEANGQEWLVYRRGVGGPLALSVGVRHQSAHMDILITPSLLRLIGEMFVESADDS